MILENNNRVGNFTSSEIWRLMTYNKAKTDFGAQGLSYIQEKRIERKLGRSISMNKGTQSTKWGNFLERRVHDLLPLSYKSVSKVTLQHPEYPFWCGSPDNVEEETLTVADTKCYEPQNFAEYNDVLKVNDTELWKAEFPKEYWQLVSNACILGYKNIEAIVYMPYKSELDVIRDMVINYDEPDQWKYRFIVECSDYELPFLPDGNEHYKNLNIYRFTCPESDKLALTERVQEAERSVKG